jgi:hypothetical protein
MAHDFGHLDPNKHDLSKFTPTLVEKSDDGIGVMGISNSGTGVEGISTSGTGVEGDSTSGAGVWGESQQGEGVHGISHSIAAGVRGVNDNAKGGAGVLGESHHFDGVFGESHSSQHAGVTGRNKSGGMAGFFDGDVVVTGTLTAKIDVVLGADCAEEFDVVATEEIEPGTVMVLDEHAALRPSQQAYDRKVAGVISGAGSYRPGIILDKKESSENRMPLALVGKVYCKVDARYAPIEVGDLLTTSATLGHAMKAEDPLKAFGAVIGKALHPLEVGQGMIPILITLQ